MFTLGGGGAHCLGQALRRERVGSIDAERVIADLRELARRTSDEAGAQRLCWGEGWRAARDFLGELLAEIGLEPEIDEAGNAWAYLRRRAGTGTGGRLASRLGAERRLARRCVRGDGCARGAPRLGGRGGAATADARARRLGRRGGRPLRAQPVRQFGGGGDIRPGGARQRTGTPTAGARRECWPRTASISSGSSTPALGWTGSAPISSSTSSRARSWRPRGSGRRR